MARYRSRTRPFYVLTPPEPKTQDRKNSRKNNTRKNNMRKKCMRRKYMRKKYMSSYTTDIESDYASDIKSSYITDIASGYASDIKSSYTTDIESDYASDIKSSYITDIASGYASEFEVVLTSLTASLVTSAEAIVEMLLVVVVAVHTAITSAPVSASGAVVVAFLVLCVAVLTDVTAVPVNAAEAVVVAFLVLCVAVLTDVTAVPVNAAEAVVVAFLVLCVADLTVVTVVPVFAAEAVVVVLLVLGVAVLTAITAAPVIAAEAVVVVLLVFGVAVLTAVSVALVTASETSAVVLLVVGVAVLTAVTAVPINAAAAVAVVLLVLGVAVLTAGIQLDEPSYPVAKQPEEEVVSKRHGVTITKIPKPNSSEISSMVNSPRQRNMSSDIKSVRTLPENLLTRNNVNSITDKTESLKLCKKQSNDELPKRVNTSENVDKSVPDVKVMVSADEDDCLEIRDSCSSPSKGDNSYKDTLKVESGEDSSEDSSESENAESEDAESENAENSMIVGGCSETSDQTSPGSKSVQKPHKIHREHKKRKFRDLLPALKRSQSVGCESDMAPDHALFLQSCPGLQQNKTDTDNADPARRMIHKTCSADAAMMAGEVLPLDPQDLSQKHEEETAGVEATEHRLAARGSHYDNGIEMFRSFLKSEFSEENIEFWSACEEFKNIRTNKLAARELGLKDAAWRCDESGKPNTRHVQAGPETYTPE
ncbi:RGS16-like protein [Mya arenaria]|uniref:RGS16-like protein n=1 Tax=Mya arenaria TaxID=6604 RepID=A0ABY7GBT6_MYAAR|nr:RGS16-like protein [Mya arenaria]